MNRKVEGGDDQELAQGLSTPKMNEARLSGVIESAMDGIISVDEQQKIILFNPAAEKMFGHRAIDLLGQSLDRLIPQRFRSSHHGDIRAFGESNVTCGKMGPLESIYGLRANGKEFPIEASISQTEMTGRKLFTIILRDVTERNRTNAALRESEQRYRSLFENMIEGYAYCRILFEDGTPNDFIYLEVNNKFESITGLKNVTGKKVSEVIPGIREANPELIQTYSRVALTGKPEKFETYVDSLGIWFSVAVYSPAKEHFVAVFDNITERKQTAEQMRLQGTALESAGNAVVNRAGKITHFVGIKQDITEKTRAQEALQASELRYRRLFESAKDGILILDAGSGQIIDVNPFLIEMLDYSKEDLVGKELWEIGVFKDVLGSKAAFVQLQQQGYIRYENLPLETRGGLVKDVEFVSNCYLAGTSRVIQCNIRDITEHKRALRETNQHLEQTLLELQAKTSDLAAVSRQLWQASKLALMGELAASIAHELNNPLATVGLRTETLLMQIPEDSNQRRPLEIIAQELDRMATLVNNLLQFSRRRHRQVSTVDSREEITNSVEFFHYHLRTHKIEVTLDFADSLPTIQADRQQLQQLFLNLLTNASDAMPQGGKLIVRAQSSVLDVVEAVAIDFADTGEGITPENLEKLWEPFFTTKPVGKGTGLGMAICRRIVEEHGGTISVQSKAGHGTTVRIVLPTTSNGAAANLL